MNKNVEFDNTINNKKTLDNKEIKSAVKWSILEYSLFVTKLVKKGISLFNDKSLGKGWFSGIYIDNQGEVEFTDPFTMENRPKSNHQLLGAVGSFNLNDAEGYYLIPDTNNKFVEVLDNKGEIDKEFNLKNYKLRLTQPGKASIRKYDDAVSIFIKNEIQKGSFLDLFELYLGEKIKILNH